MPCWRRSSSYLSGSRGVGYSGPTPEQLAIKDAFIRQLIGFCAEVDRQLANIDPKAQPGIFADQFALFVAQARRQPAPELDRDQFKIMLTEFDATVGAIPRGTDRTGRRRPIQGRCGAGTGEPGIRVPTRRRRSTACRRSTPALNTRRGRPAPDAVRGACSRCGVVAAARGGGGGAAG